MSQYKHNPVITVVHPGLPNSGLIPANSEMGAFVKKRVAAYARVSTSLDEQENSFLSQVSYYMNYIKEHPNWQLYAIYADRGCSGTSYKKRPQFNKMIAAAKAGEIDLIITKSISRFARNTLDS